MPIQLLPTTFRARCLLAAFACAAMLAYAFYAQFQEGLMPCAFCIFQRVCYAALGLVFLVAGLHAPRPGTPRKIYAVLAALIALIGAGIAFRHVWVQLYPPPMAMCGSPLDFMLETMSLDNVIRKVLTATGDCSNTDWKLFGMTMPAWSLIAFLGFAGWAIRAGWSTHARDGWRRFK